MAISTNEVLIRKVAGAKFAHCALLCLMAPPSTHQKNLVADLVYRLESYQVFFQNEDELDKLNSLKSLVVLLKKDLNTASDQNALETIMGRVFQFIADSFVPSKSDKKNAFKKDLELYRNCILKRLDDESVEIPFFTPTLYHSKKSLNGYVMVEGDAKQAKLIFTTNYKAIKRAIDKLVTKDDLSNRFKELKSNRITLEEKMQNSEKLFEFLQDIIQAAYTNLGYTYDDLSKYTCKRYIDGQMSLLREFLGLPFRRIDILHASPAEDLLKRLGPHRQAAFLQSELIELIENAHPGDLDKIRGLEADLDGLRDKDTAPKSPAWTDLHEKILTLSQGIPKTTWSMEEERKDFLAETELRIQELPKPKLIGEAEKIALGAGGFVFFVLLVLGFVYYKRRRLMTEGRKSRFLSVIYLNKP